MGRANKPAPIVFVGLPSNLGMFTAARGVGRLWLPSSPGYHHRTMSDHELPSNPEELPGATATLPRPQRDPRVKQPGLWHVLLLNDDDHTDVYVVDMMKRLFAHPVEKGLLIAKTVDSQGRAVCGTFHKELAELKMEQIHGFGKDRLIAGCKGSMSAAIEPAETDEGDQAE